MAQSRQRLLKLAPPGFHLQAVDAAKAMVVEHDDDQLQPRLTEVAISEFIIM